MIMQTHSFTANTLYDNIYLYVQYPSINYLPVCVCMCVRARVYIYIYIYIYNPLIQLFSLAKQRLDRTQSSKSKAYLEAKF
jgi:hypothetical protein